MKLFLALATIFLLSACNVEKALMQNIAVSSHQSMSFERFERLSDIELQDDGETVYNAPGLSFGMGTNVKLRAWKDAKGEIAYRLFGQLEYAQSPMRYYSEATDMYGKKLKFKRLSANERGCSGQVCYKNESFMIWLTEEMINEALNEDLLLTIKAPAHEKQQSKRNRNRNMGLNEMLALANEARGGTNQEYKENDNFDFVIPKEYVRNFIKLIQSQ